MSFTCHLHNTKLLTVTQLKHPTTPQALNPLPHPAPLATCQLFPTFLEPPSPKRPTPWAFRLSFGLSATSQQYFSLRTNQQSVSSTFLSQQISTSHQPNEQAVLVDFKGLFVVLKHVIKFSSPLYLSSAPLKTPEKRTQLPLEWQSSTTWYYQNHVHCKILARWLTCQGMDEGSSVHMIKRAVAYLNACQPWVSIPPSGNNKAYTTWLILRQW
jgi:hypothetical protein